MTSPKSPAWILETALYAENLDKAEAFYSDVLGLDKIFRQGTRHVFFRCGDTILLVFNPKETLQPAVNPKLPVPAHGALGAGHLCLQASASELDNWKILFDTKGVEIEADFNWPGGARSLYIRDPAGNSIEFAQAKLWFPDCGSTKTDLPV